jgi:hypothetical protein
LAQSEQQIKRIGAVLLCGVFLFLALGQGLSATAQDSNNTPAISLDCSSVQDCFSLYLQQDSQVATRLNTERNAFIATPNDGRISTAPPGTLIFDWGNEVNNLEQISKSYGENSSQYESAAVSMVQQAINEYQTEATYRLDLGNTLSKMLPALKVLDAKIILAAPTGSFSPPEVFAPTFTIEANFNLTLAKFRQAQVNSIKQYQNDPIPLKVAQNLTPNFELVIFKLPSTSSIAPLSYSTPPVAYTYAYPLYFSYWNLYPIYQGEDLPLEPSTAKLADPLFQAEIQPNYERISDEINTEWTDQQIDDYYYETFDYHNNY